MSTAGLLSPSTENSSLFLNAGSPYPLSSIRDGPGHTRRTVASSIDGNTHTDEPSGSIPAAPTVAMGDYSDYSEDDFESDTDNSAPVSAVKRASTFTKQAIVSAKGSKSSGARPGRSKKPAMKVTHDRWAPLPSKPEKHATVSAAAVHNSKGHVKLKNRVVELERDLLKAKAEIKTLKTIQRRQDKALDKYCDEETEIPKLLKSKDEELRTCEAKYRKMKERARSNETAMKAAQKRQLIAEDLVARYKKTISASNLDERVALQEEVTQLKALLHSRDLELTRLNRHVEIVLKEKQRAQSELAVVKKAIEKLKKDAANSDASIPSSPMRAAPLPRSRKQIKTAVSPSPWLNIEADREAAQSMAASQAAAEVAHSEAVKVARMRAEETAVEEAVQAQEEKRTTAAAAAETAAAGAALTAEQQAAKAAVEAEVKAAAVAKAAEEKRLAAEKAAAEAARRQAEEEELGRQKRVAEEAARRKREEEEIARRKREEEERLANDAKVAEALRKKEALLAKLKAIDQAKEPSPEPIKENTPSPPKAKTLSPTPLSSPSPIESSLSGLPIDEALSPLDSCVSGEPRTQEKTEAPEPSWLTSGDKVSSPATPKSAKSHINPPNFRRTDDALSKGLPSDGRERRASKLHLNALGGGAPSNGGTPLGGRATGHGLSGSAGPGTPSGLSARNRRQLNGGTAPSDSPLAGRRAGQVAETTDSSGFSAALTTGLDTTGDLGPKAPVLPSISAVGSGPIQRESSSAGPLRSSAADGAISNAPLPEIAHVPRKDEPKSPAAARRLIAPGAGRNGQQGLGMKGPGAGGKSLGGLGPAKSRRPKPSWANKNKGPSTSLTLSSGIDDAVDMDEIVI